MQKLEPKVVVGEEPYQVFQRRLHLGPVPPIRLAYGNDEPKPPAPVPAHVRQGLATPRGHSIRHEHVGCNIQKVAQVIWDLSDHPLFDVLDPEVDVWGSLRKPQVNGSSRVAGRGRPAAIEKPLSHWRLSVAAPREAS